MQSKNPPNKITSFTNLIAWQEAHKLVLSVYKTTHELPSKEKYNVVDQLERAVVSITNNIAEGFGRKSAKEMGQFLYISLGSLKEVQSMLLICRDLGHISPSEFALIANQSASVSRLLRGIIRANKLKQS